MLLIFLSSIQEEMKSYLSNNDLYPRFSGLDATKRFLNVPHSDYAVSLRNARQVGRVEKNEYP